MEKKYIKLEPTKRNNIGFIKKITKLFESKKKRYLFTALFILPFLIAIGLFGFIAFKEAKSLISLLKGNVEVDQTHIIETYNYQLRDNATDIQEQYFAELKDAIEVNVLSDEEIAGLVCKNYVVDFYTWTNKQGQYDISAMYYVYTPQKEAIFLQARDGFYKYINTYINEYGVSNLLEVETVTVNSSRKQNYSYTSASNEEFDEVYLVSCSWTYKANSKFSTALYPTSSNFLVVKREGRMEIVEASEGTINVQHESNED